MLFQTGFGLQETIDYLVEIGVYDVFLPFLLVFSMVFAILEKTKILGSDKTNINAVVAVVVGLLLVVQKGIVEIINLFLPRVSLIMVVILMGLLLIAMVAGKEFTGVTGTTFGVAVVLIIISIIIALTAQPGGGPIWLSQADKETLIKIGVPLLIFLVVLQIVTAKPKQQQKPNLFKRLAEDFGGKGSSE